MVDSEGVKSWIKGIYWTDKLVARVSWGARPPNPGMTGYMDPLNMVGVLGHHTTGNQCTTQSSCITKMQNFQEEDMNNGLR